MSIDDLTRLVGLLLLIASSLVALWRSVLKAWMEYKQKKVVLQDRQFKLMKSIWYFQKKEGNIDYNVVKDAYQVIDQQKSRK